MKFIIIILLIGLSFLSCNESSSERDIKSLQVSKSDTISSKSSMDFSSAVIQVERGAFHYDKFVLKDTVITYYPSSEKFEKKYDAYNYTSEQKISKSTRDSLISYVVNNGFFDLKDSYSSKSSCASQLIVTFKWDNRSKRIVSEDFERDCPELLKYIEAQIVILHHKNLKRIFLPG
ncbi:hypothetical protein [Aquimarina sediminis]|uniref:hypothetical protein n=1 Tax=Aquimarina sediminis TaxID=2070536 RepID=UPI000FFEEC59|nr:hypothetical protein [Aquimarina sediminis]